MNPTDIRHTLDPGWAKDLECVCYARVSETGSEIILAIEPRNKIRHSAAPLEGEDARRFVEEVDGNERSEKQHEFLKQSKGVFRKVFSPRPANDLFAKDS